MQGVGRQKMRVLKKSSSASRSSDEDMESEAGTDQDTEDTQILSLSSELASFVAETKVDSVTHRVAVSKERLRNRFKDIEL